MIQLKRNRDGISSKLTGQKRLEHELLLLRGQHSGDLEKLGSKFWNGNDHWKAGKPTLITDSHGKCAYCEAPTRVVAHGDVEHFRPKSVYWWLAYCYDNHLFACQICNQTHKGENFPISGKKLSPPRVKATISDARLHSLAGTLAPDPGDRVAVKSFFDQLAGEQADLLDPYATKPESFFKWSADDVLKEVEIQPRSRSPNHQRVFNAVQQFYGLNREELRCARWSLVYQYLADRKENLNDLDANRGNATKRANLAAKINGMLEDRAPFAGMARYFVRKEWKLKL